MMAVAYNTAPTTQLDEPDRLADLLDRLDGVRPSGQGYTARCPAHDDASPSLSVGAGDVQPVILHCFAGCAPDDIIRAAGLEPTDILRGSNAAPPPQPKVRARYDYADESGLLLYQVERWEPGRDGRKKDFFQRRPDGMGGWSYKLGDVRRVLYRLPELLDSGPAETVYVVEGEKDVDRLRSLGALATCNAGGAGKWRPEYAEALAGRRVVILPDNDEPGQRHAQTVASSVGVSAESLRVVTLPGLPPKGDVSDWLDAGGTVEQLGALANSAPEWDGNPIATAATSPSINEVPPFPTDVLPPVLRDFVEQAAKDISCPPDFVATPLLVAAGAAIGNALELRLSGTWTEGPNLFAAIVARPGAKKSPALAAATRPLYAFQKRLIKEHDALLVEYEMDLAEWEKSRKTKDGPPSPKPQKPVLQHLITTDATVEALGPMLRVSDGILLSMDELSAWVRAMDQYKGNGKGADRQHFLSMWNRTTLKIDRKGADAPVFVSRPCLSVVGGIQPDMLSELADPGQRQDGFVARLLWSYPDDVEDRFTMGGVSESVERRLNEVFGRLIRLEAEPDRDDGAQPRTVRLSEQALELWREWYEEWAAEKLDPSLAPSLEGTVAKLSGQLARLALILHTVETVSEGPVTEYVSVETLGRAMELVDYFKAHARRALTRNQPSRTQRPGLGERILTALREHGPLKQSAIVSDVLHGNTRADEVSRALEQLERDGMLSREKMGGTGGRDAVVWRAR